MTTSVAISDTGMAIVGIIVVRAALQKNVYDQNDQKERFGQREDNVMHGRRDETGRVVVHPVGDAFGEPLREFFHLRHDALLQIERVGTRHLKDGKNHRRVFAEKRRGRILQRPKLNPRHIAQPISWDRTGLVVAEISAGGRTGLGYSYAWQPRRG